MCNLNNKDDSTIKLLILVLFYKGGGGGSGFCASEFIQIQLPLSSSFKKGYIKLGKKSTSANVPS